MPDFSPRTFSSTSERKFQLQLLLDEKEKQLQQAGTLGQRVLAQQIELEERVRQLQDLDAERGDDEDFDSEARERYRELAETIKTWNSENAQLSSAFGSKRINEQQSSPTLPISDVPRDREEPERNKTPASSAAQSRRAKNAAHRADDVEFAFEIGSGLLTEVRRLQSLLGERDKAIQDMKEEKDDLEKTVESLRTALRSQEQSSDKYKEENWNLEVTLQELRTQLSDSQSTTIRLEGEQKRLTKLLNMARESTDQHKNESERVKNALEELKAKHETDVAQARKHAAGLQRDKSDLQSSLDAMKAEVAKANRRLGPRYGSPLTPNAGDASHFLTPAMEEDDVFSAGGVSTNRRKMDSSAIFPAESFEDIVDVSPDPSPSRPFIASNHPSNEIEALTQRLAHAQRTINTLKGTLHREKEMRMEYRRKLESSPGLDHDENQPPDDEIGFEDVEPEQKSGRRLTPFRSGGSSRARGRRGRGGPHTLAHRLGMAAQSPSPSDYNGDDFTSSSPPPPVPPIPSRFSTAEDEFADFVDEYLSDEDDRELGYRSPSPLAPPSNRTSVDGMDPTFANILRKSASFSSLPSSSSPLRQSVIARPARGGAPQRRSRGGAAYQEARPASLVGQPEALALELGIGMTSVVEDDMPKETAEFGCQTDFEDIALVVPPVSPPTMSEMAVQVDPEPVVPSPPEVVPVPIPVAMAEMSCQTDDEVVIERVEMAIQHDDPTPLPVMVSASINTDPEVVPIAPVMVQTGSQTPPLHSVDIHTQTTPVAATEKADMDAQTSIPDRDRVFHAPGTNTTPRRTTITQYDISRSSEHSGDSTLRGAPSRLFISDGVGEDDEDIDDGATETGAETETDTDDYHDARGSIGMSTPSESREDFHSMMTMTDNDFSESDEDDDVSIKASMISSRTGRSSMASLTERRNLHYRESRDPSPSLTYESKGVSAEVIDEIKPVEEPRIVEVIKTVEVIKVVEVEAHKPEVSEISIQTDDWMSAPAPAPEPVPVPVVAPAPPAPAPELVSTAVQTIEQDVSPAPAVPTSPNTTPLPMYRVGSTGQQFQFVPISPRPTIPSSPAASPSPAATIRDSAATFGIIRPRTSHSERRESIESAISSVIDDPQRRARTPSAVPSLVDKTRPPMMVVPPPPRQPPPATMPPPSFIPERRFPTTSSASHDVPPPRPSSPPPPELIQRATTPTFGSMLSVHGRGSYGPRQHGSSMPPPQSNLRQPPSTSSFRSAANAATYAQNSMAPTLSSWPVREKQRPQFSSTSLASDRSALSPRSSMSSDHNVFANNAPPNPNAPATPNKTMEQGEAGGSTDPAVIHAITQTMIGEFLYKYTRRAIGKGHGEKRHKRFFWVHPYTKTLYWSSADPGSSNVSESTAKSAYIEGVRSVLDPNPMPPGLYQYSVVLSTSQREMKITAPTKERHDIWLNALKYLLARPNAVGGSPSQNGNGVPTSPMSQSAELTDDDHRHMVESSPQSQRSGRSSRNGGAFSTTPRGTRSRSQLSVRGSVGKRSGTPAAEYLRWAGPESPYSPTKSFEQILSQGQDEDDLEFELHGDSMLDDAFEGLENVRACCDGRHTVGHSGHHHHHHNHNHNHNHAPQLNNIDHLDVHQLENARPASPAWSLRSRAGSAKSHEGGGGLFSWGRDDEGKLRFGSRRSMKTVHTAGGDR
ncbi:hypothetical protein BJ138DRAFT_1124484 [Hygrophoropsis aurantiaca]|uniref:Uncharacterized protein n=1 Tax=Hygrophoropsis aurantiaca TaxID=72124 RepID=A0ACB8AJ68_9AGAM|nr:hypothetical protein BJ138DRAFT_1124484 [Hygrophoropsis aurantiaca]